MAIAFDVGGKSSVQGSGASLTFTGPTVGTLTNGLVVVGVPRRGGASANSNLNITGITYNGVAMTQGPNVNSADSPSSNTLAVDIWYLVNPPSGAKTIVVSYSGTVNTCVAYVASFSGVDQTNPLDASNTSKQNASSSPNTTSVTTVTNGAWLFDVIYNKIGTSLTRGASQTLVAAESLPNGGGDTADGSYKGPIATAGSTSMSWTFSGTDDYAHAVMAIRPVVTTTTKTQTGKGSIRVTTTQTQTGKTRITQTTSQTQTGKSRVTATTTRTQTGVADIRGTTTQTQQGRARVTITTSQTQTGKGRIEIASPQTQTGRSRVTATTAQSQPGKSRVTATTSQAQTGKSAIQKTTTKTQTGLSRIELITTRDQTGVSRVTTTTSRTQNGKARVTAITPQTQTGKSRVTATTTQTQTGVANIASPSVTTSKDQTGKARITVTTSQNQTGQSRITATATRTQSGKARITQTTPQTQTGVADIRGTTARTQTGISSIRRTTTKTQPGKSRIANTISSDTYAGQALMFPTDNTGGRISVTNNAALNNLTAFTFETWVYFTNIQQAYTIRLADKNAATNKGFSITISPNSQSISALVGNGTTQVSTSSGTLPLLQKTHIALTWDGSKVRFFIGGTKVGSDVTLSGGDTGDDGGALIIGNRGIGDREFSGIIDEVRYSSVARYTANFTPPSDAFTNDTDTILLLHLDEGQGTSLTDSSSNGLSASITGSTLPTWTTGFFSPAGFPHTGKAKITATTSPTQAGKASILNAVTQNQTGKARITQTTTQTQSGVARIARTTTRTQTGTSTIGSSAVQTQTGQSRMTATATQTQVGKAAIRKTTTQTQTGKSRIQQTVNGFYYQDFAGNVRPPDWQEYGNSTWSYSAGAVTETSVGSNDPNKVLYLKDFGQQVIVQATLTVQAVGSNDDRFGITILGDSDDVGRGINLNIRDSNALQFLDDGIAWGTSTSLTINVGDVWILKGMYQGGVFYGKAWKQGQVEPDWMITWTRTPQSRYKYPGITGNSASKTARASYDDFYVVALPSLQGRSRVTAITTRTQTGKARVTATTTQTQTGKARVTATTTRTQTGVARIEQTTIRTQTGVSRIALITTRTQQGTSCVTHITGQTTTGTANIFVPLRDPICPPGSGASAATLQTVMGGASTAKMRAAGSGKSAAKLNAPTGPKTAATLTVTGMGSAKAKLNAPTKGKASSC